MYTTELSVVCLLYTLCLINSNKLLKDTLNATINYEIHEITERCQKGSVALNLDEFKFMVTLDTGRSDLDIFRNFRVYVEEINQELCSISINNFKCVDKNPTNSSKCICVRSAPPVWNILVQDIFPPRLVKGPDRSLRNLILELRMSHQNSDNVTKVVSFRHLTLSSEPIYCLQVDNVRVNLTHCELRYVAGSVHSFRFCSLGLHAPQVEVSLSHGERDRGGSGQQPCAEMRVVVPHGDTRLRLNYSDTCGRSGAFVCAIRGVYSRHNDTRRSAPSNTRRPNDKPSSRQNSETTSMQNSETTRLPVNDSMIDNLTSVTSKHGPVHMFEDNRTTALTFGGIALVIISFASFVLYSIYLQRDAEIRSHNT